MIEWALFLLCAGFAVGAGVAVFRSASMLRAALALGVSFCASAVLMLQLESEFLFAVTVLMMVGEAVIMAVFMVAFMDDPAGLTAMRMVRRGRFAAFAAGGLFLLLAAIALTTEFPQGGALPPSDLTAAVGRELLGRSMLPFETAGIVLLAAMIAVVAIAGRRGRYGTATPGDAPPDAPFPGR